MRVEGYVHAGGRHAATVALRNLLTHAGVVAPHTGEPPSEPLVFGVAGGVGAGYSFCPSVVRYGGGAGIWVVGRHKAYVTGADWYRAACDRLGVTTRVTETGGPGKAFENLAAELRAGRPTVVWVSKARLPFLGCPANACDLWMHEFVVFALDESTGIAHGSDRSAMPVTISLDDLAAARRGVCSHKNRTLTIDPPGQLTLPRLRDAVLAGLRACAAELLSPKIKTFGLPGLDLLTQRIANGKHKDGWPVVFAERFLFDALCDVFMSVETNGSGGGLFRPLFADTLAEAAAVTGRPRLAELAGVYRELGKRWTDLADAALSDRVPAFKKAEAALRKRDKLLAEKGQKADAQIAAANATLAGLGVEVRKQFPLDAAGTAAHLDGLRERLISLYRDEVATAEALKKAVA
ncbi:MAG TPA: DUF4872 domain-containing protein [Gemmataceae bacterium]|jgi:hypothetical protein